MIKANELRIGNWVKVKSGFGKVATIEDEDGDYAGVVANDDDSVWERISMAYDTDIEPISLTPEILEKCGFVRDDRRGRRTKLYHYPNISINDNSFFYFDKSFQVLDKDLNAKWTVDCEHLHQLQNLYFALTGEELNVNL